MNHTTTMRMTCGPTAFKVCMPLTHRPGTKPLKFGLVGPRGKCNSCSRPCGAPAVRARAKPGICFLLLPTTSKVHVHCTHEIMVVCALCFYMWSLLDSTCGKIWWNVYHIQRLVVLGFAISILSDWLYPMTNFQS